MTPQFKQELQKLIDDAAEKYGLEVLPVFMHSSIRWIRPKDDEDVHLNDRQKIIANFKAGCEFLIPMIESLLVTRNNYIAATEYSDNHRLQNIHNKALLNLLRGVKCS